MGFDPDVLDAVRHVAIAGIADRLGIPRKGSRYYCPSCQPGGPAEHKTPDLSITENRGFHCFKCGMSGGDGIALIRKVEGLDFPDAVRRVANFAGILLEDNHKQSPEGRNRPHTSSPRGFSGYPGESKGEFQKTTTPLFGGSVKIPENPPSRPDLLPVVMTLVDALRGSPGEKYLRARGFEPELAETYGIGYASPERCREIGFDSGSSPESGRVVFPHYTLTDEMNSSGQRTTALCSLYGRAVELSGSGTVSKSLRHRHLPGPKGWFNIGAVDATGFGDLLFLCEGSFDALALIAAGYKRVVATYGVQIGRPDWLRKAREVCIAFDFDATGENKASELARALQHNGKTVYRITPEELGKASDIAEAWQRGTLNLTVSDG